MDDRINAAKRWEIRKALWAWCGDYGDGVANEIIRALNDIDSKVTGNIWPPHDLHTHKFESEEPK